MKNPNKKNINKSDIHRTFNPSKIVKILKNSYQYRILMLLFLILVSWAAMRMIKTNTVDAGELQEGIASDIIRFHVIANSDSNEDQTLKYIVKDALVKEISPYLRDAKDITEARLIVSGKLAEIKETAEVIVQQNHCNYPVTVSLAPCYFPLKVYGNYTFPPGTYEALRVQIGEAKGKNWWCVMFPPLCFVDETYSIVDKESEKQLIYLLTEQEYDSLRDQKVPVKIKFKLFESLKKLFST